MKKVIFICFLFLTTLQTFAQNTASFEKFWSAFQPLLVAKNFTALEKYVQFPLAAKGVLDEMPVLKITKTQFAKAFGTYLSTDDINLNGTKMETYKKWKKIPANQKQYIQNGYARIDDMEFKYKNGKWLLILFYDGRTE